MADFDFDHWCALAERDPEAYFRARRGVIEGFIGERPEEEAGRLREMQGCIDRARAAAGTPLNAVRSVTRMMEGRLLAMCEQGVALRCASERLGRAVTHLEGGAG
ncbi:DUF3135 domain-containing protein [Pseudothauera nasutitermitis]|uniref:DUF3135 domain-containing protein n=1 Tax=Pseudothauera nasutitermitis TaxID=2565930 RepID=A0A4S4B6R3_9RHOO|nr:DUF3135 domain-containing protein [Pseudothauera nasutitermitis]